MKYDKFIKDELYIYQGKILKYTGRDEIRTEDESHHRLLQYVKLHFINTANNTNFDIDTDIYSGIDASGYFEPIKNTNGKFICPECKAKLPPAKNLWNNFMHNYTCSLKGFIPNKYEKTKKYKIQLNKQTNNINL